MRRVTADAESDTFSPMSAMVRRALRESNSMILWSVWSSSASPIADQTNEGGSDCVFGAAPLSGCRGGLPVHRHGVLAAHFEGDAVPTAPAVLELEPDRGGQGVVPGHAEPARTQRVARKGVPPVGQQ